MRKAVMFVFILAFAIAPLSAQPKNQETLQEIFNNWWNPFSQKVKAALAKIPKKESKQAERGEKEMLEEILGIVRSMQRQNTPSLAERLLATSPAPSSPSSNDYLAMLLNTAPLEQPVKLQEARRNNLTEALARFAELGKDKTNEQK